MATPLCPKEILEKAKENKYIPFLILPCYLKISVLKRSDKVATNIQLHYIPGQYPF